jgi:hypothetical protein
MTAMTEPTEPKAAETAQTSGETAPPAARRQLDRAPSDRFARLRRGSDLAGIPAEGGSPIRAILMGVLGASIGTIIFLVLAVVFSFSAGLIVVAIFTGRFAGLFVRAGAAGTLSSPARVALSVVIFLIAQTVAIVVTWMAAGLEGGVLPLGDYLGQVYGTPLISLEFMLGTLMAWWSAR